MKLFFSCGLMFVLAWSLPQMTSAQLSVEKPPYSFEHDVPEGVPVAAMPPVNVAELIAQDRAESPNRPVRFGKPHEVNLGLEDAGKWNTLADGGRLWRLQIKSPNAYSINLIFSQYRLPEEATLHVYSSDTSHVIGAFTAQNNKTHSRFSTAPVQGDQITLEYYEPADAAFSGEIQLSHVIHAYRNFFGRRSPRPVSKLYGDSESCNININCSEGDPWQKEEGAVAMLMVDLNNRGCTGFLVNNEREDFSPYLMTAYHCVDSNEDGSISSSEEQAAEVWMALFDYESPYCTDYDGPKNHDVSGMDFRAGHSDSDFTLFELNASPHPSWDIYYAGWSATGSTPNSTVSIHHPRGDIKKIAIDDQSPQKDDWTGDGPNAPANSHWLVDFDDGTIERGSSGAPLFNDNHRVIGQVHGGSGGDRCTVRDGLYGRFSWSWDNGSSAATRLKDWLDPDNTNLTSLRGLRPLYVYMQGTSQATEGEERTWDTNAKGGDPNYNYTYKWYYRLSGGSWSLVRQTTKSSGVDSYTRVIPSSDFELEGRVSIASDGMSDHIYVTVSSSGDGEGGEALRAHEKLPTEFSLGQNAPNPFSNSTQIRFALPEPSHVRLVLYDVTGRVIARLVDKTMSAGTHRVQVDTPRLSSGVYLYSMQTGDFQATRQMVVVR